MDVQDMIFRIGPQESPIFDFTKYGARIKLRPGRFGSMRAKKRRIAKPQRFTPSFAARRVYEWTVFGG